MVMMVAAVVVMMPMVMAEVMVVAAMVVMSMVVMVMMMPMVMAVAVMMVVMVMIVAHCGRLSSCFDPQAKVWLFSVSCLSARNRRRTFLRKARLSFIGSRTDLIISTYRTYHLS